MQNTEEDLVSGVKDMFLFINDKKEEKKYHNCHLQKKFKSLAFKNKILLKPFISLSYLDKYKTLLN